MSQISSNSQKCSLHKTQYLDFYCQSCKDPVCQTCKTQQPHSGCFHKVIPLQQAYQNRTTNYQNYKQSVINPLRFRVGQKIQQLKKSLEFLESVKNAIFKDINVEYMNIDEKLKNATSSQILKYQTSIKHRQNYLNILDDISYSFQNVMNDPAKFLMFYKKVDEQLNQLQSVELQDKIQEGTVKLPRQVKQTYQKIQMLPQYEKRNQLMNILLQKTVNKYQADFKNKQKQIKAQQKRVKGVYISMNHKLANMKQAKVCIFCSNPFSLDLCNDPCAQNRTFNAVKTYPDIQVPQQARGVKRHFWVNAELKHRKKPQKDSHSVIKLVMKKQFENSLKDIKSVKYQIQKCLLQKQTTLQKIFKVNDKQQKGVVSKIAFIYHLTKDFNIAKIHAQYLADLLVSQDGIKYKQIYKVLEKPEQIYESYVKQQEQYEKEKPIAPKSSSFKCRY